MDNTTKTTAEELHDQWLNPGDIFSLLLLVGGDIVQKAIAQLVGYEAQVALCGRQIRIPITPVAFSFGLVSYGFSSLLSVVGNTRLMPDTDCPSIAVNCSNGFSQETQSWVLGRLLRDHEARFPIDRKSEADKGRAESIRVDVFRLGPAAPPSLDFIWWLGWFTIPVQLTLAAVPWVLYRNWSIFMVVLAGNILTAVTCSLPQWSDEKWAGRKLEKRKVMCLTRGNGGSHIMVLVGERGSWDLESLARASPVARPETRWISLTLAILWTCLLISVTGLQNHTWFLVGIGSLGMIQNVFAAGTRRSPEAFGFALVPFERAPTIIGKRRTYEDDDDAGVDLDKDLESLEDLEKWARKKPTNSVLADSKAQAVQMPPWLRSMSGKDGTPQWLEAIEPQATSAAQTGSKAKEAGYSTTASDKTIYAVGVHGALIELEKWMPTAGLAMVQIFFPSGLIYNDERIRDNVHKKFWKRAYATQTIRKMAEEKRHAEDCTNKAYI
ncbi:hypothetical protein jhhlp_008833 [Lomentospora prolificans]|uniref:Uncharacterized protein n=1 Tax=Lomentospora prolificans TaxID=41688 RepID=A0A2N3MZ51_9PEZI|nr:hypothetical protein jhhlp_008833 [Lomentospora prolificans]